MEIRPFKGWRYCPQDGDISNLIAPPYDVLNQTDKDRLLAGSENNIVAVDLPYMPPKQVGPDEVYQQAAQRLEQWKNDGLLVQDEKPSIYLYHQTYTWAGKTYTRRAMWCGVRATELGEDVIPHEHTFAGPKADRLKLTEYTQTQLSPIFGIYEDPQGQIDALLDEVSQSAPTLHGTMNDVKEELWIIQDSETIEKIATALKDTPAYIADGHHRYTTAMNYAKSLRESGQIDADDEKNFVMFALVSQAAPGLLILPTHRMMTGLADGFSVEDFIAQATDFSWKQVDPASVDLTDADAFLAPFGKSAMAVVANGGKDIYVGTLSNDSAMEEAAPEECKAWQELDVAILHKLLIEKALKPWTTDDTSIEYTAYGQEVLDAIAEGKIEMGICLQGTPLQAVKDIADAGASMPHKSTYFYPKLATGIVLKPLQ